MLSMSKLQAKKVGYQKGFTLLELLMVIAVIGVLASIAVPRFQNAATKAKFTEVINAAGPYKIAVEMCITNKGSKTDCNQNSEGIPDGYKDGAGKVASVSVVGGKITVTGNSADFGELTTSASGATASASSNLTYELTPTVGNGITWEVGGSCTTQKLCD